MARKSRKNQSKATELVVSPLAVSEKIPAAVYARLSLENSGHEDDRTLQTQISMCVDYIKNQSDLQLIDTYVDNGFTGMNFDRPDFTRLIEDVKTGRIRCIVVKDLSRFGRDYLETGYYIETIFPKLNVRLIAITDEFDSNRPEDRESLAVPIKNIVNTLYAKDISRKIASSYEMKRRRGETMGTFPPYGYCYNEERTRYLVDEEAAPYVRMMFQWAVNGLSKHEIARRLQLMGVPTPRQRQIMLSEGRVDTEFTKWHGSVVLKLLINPVYMGDTVTGKTRRAAYKNQGLTYIDPEEWCYTHNTHEPLVSREDFEIIQQRRTTNKQRRTMALEKSKSEREKLPDCFRGLVFCADCGGIMRMFRNSHDETEKSFSQYTCVAKKSTHSCARHSIQENLLKMLVMDQIRIMIKAMCDRKQVLEKYMRGNKDIQQLAEAKGVVESLGRKICTAQDRRDHLYEDYVGNLLDKEEYQYMREHYIQEIQQLTEEKKSAEIEMRKIERLVSGYISTVEHLEVYLDKQEFDANLVAELVQKIEISKNGNVFITFSCADVFQQVNGMLGKGVKA